MTIVQCYAPTEDEEADEKEFFYGLLDKIDKNPKGQRSFY
jgi:hypothetical protein